MLLLDHAPGEEELRRIQAQENPREPLSLRDQQEQFRDCWQARAGLPEADRIAVVCADLGISTGKGHSLRRQLALPDPIRERVAERPAGDQLSVRMAHRLADMHDIAPELAAAVARRVTTGDLHDQALRDLGGFVHRTVVENDDVYAVRIDDGVLLDAAEQIDHARRHLTPADRTQAAAALGCKTDKLDAELDARAARARSHALKLRVDGALRDRAAKAATPGRSTAARTSPRASGSSTPSSWSTPSASSSATPTPRPSARIAISLALDSTTTTCASPPRTTASAGPPSARGTPKRPRAISASATTSAPPWPTRPTTSCTPCGRSSAACCTHYRDVIAYGAGWTDPARQQPVGDTGRHEPGHVDGAARSAMTYAPIEGPASTTEAAPTWSSTASRSATWTAIPYGPGNAALRRRPRRSGARRHAPPSSSRATVRHVISEAVTP